MQACLAAFWLGCLSCASRNSTHGSRQAQTTPLRAQQTLRQLQHDVVVQLVLQHAEPGGDKNHPGDPFEGTSVRCQLETCAESWWLTRIGSCLIFLARDSAVCCSACLKMRASCSPL